MSKSAKKRPATASGRTIHPAKSSQQTKVDPKGKDADPGSKQARLIALLQSPAGATLAALMQATGWQQHSVRGFLAGVVRKRLKLKLTSKKEDSARVYQIVNGRIGPAGARQSKRQSA